MNNNRCIMCNDIIAEGRMVCPMCENSPTERNGKSLFLNLKVEMWKIIVAENLQVTNPNIDWLLERAFKEI